MTEPEMTSLQRVLTTLGFEEPDRVPFFLLVTMHGAREMGMSIKDYFNSPEAVAEAQLKMRKKYGDDCLYNFFYAPIETEAFGGEVNYAEDGPPNSGMPIIQSPADIKNLRTPLVEESACLQKVCRATALMKETIGDEAPIIGVAMSPFSLPVMQMGFDAYIELMHEDQALFEKLMEINEAFVIAWANAQFEAGVTALAYFDPVASTTCVPREMYLKTGYEVAKRVLPQLKGPAVTHFASGRCMPIIDDVFETGTAGIVVSALENIADIKSKVGGRGAVLGNLNGIEMRTWTKEDAEQAVKTAIAGAGRGGGFVLTDNHGEIPWQVPEETLLHICEAVRKWGCYPLDWIEDEAR